jgi:transposase
MKAQVLAECDVPGASVAKIAMSHGINANVVHGWRKLARGTSAMAVANPSEFVPVALEEAGVPCAGERCIEIELRRGAVTMKLSWPLSATVDFAAWTRELLR